MKGRTAISVDDYIAAHPEAARTVLERVRAAIRGVIPEAEESIAYGMPGYKLGKRPVIYFAGWKEHYALYPGNATLVAELGDELSRYIVSKGTIRFEYADPIPVKLIQRIARLRAKEVAEAAAAKKAPAKKRGAASPR